MINLKNVVFCFLNKVGGIIKLMNELIRDMLYYSQTRDKDYWLKKYPIENDEYGDTLIVIIDDILFWLRLGYKRELWKKEKKYVKQKPLEINLNYPWCKILKNLTETNDRFSEYFCITDKQFDFKETVAEEERIEAMKYVYDNLHIARLVN